MKIKEALEEVLLCHILKKDKAWLYCHQNDILTHDQAQRYQKLISRRKNGEPIAYITKHKEFFGIDFYIDKNVLIPRPETELLVEEGLKISKFQNFKILDLGTGSGCIIISLAKSSLNCHSAFNAESIDSCFRRNDKLTFYASDISSKALKIAQKNAKKHKTKINFIKSNLFAGIPKNLKLDLIVANLPYLWEDYPLFEPRIALNGGQNGLQIIKQFLIEAKSHLKKDSTIIFEIDPRQTEKIKEITKNIYPEKLITLKKDLAGLDRITIIS